MMCALLLRPHDPVNRPRLAVAAASGSSTRSRARTTARSTVALRHPAIAMIIFLATFARERLPLQHRAEGLLPAAGQRTARRQHRRSAGRLVRGHPREDDALRGNPEVAIPRSTRSPCSRAAAADAAPPRTPAAASSRSSRARSARSPPTRSSRVCGPSSRRCRAPRSTCRPCRTCALGGRDQQRAVPVHPAERQPGRAEHVGAASGPRHARDARAARRQQRSAESRAARCRSSSTARRPRGSASARG
mgnify:CR=1 FL=1